MNFRINVTHKQFYLQNYECIKIVHQIENDNF
jgi:hypothetical protein